MSTHYHLPNGKEREVMGNIFLQTWNAQRHIFPLGKQCL